MFKRLVSAFLLLLIVTSSGCSNTLSGEVLAKTKTHTIRRIDGQCYLDLKGGNETIPAEENTCIGGTRSLEFDSIEEMFQKLTAEPFTENELTAIRQGFTCTEHGFIIPDPYKLYSLVLPDAVQVNSIILQSNYHYFTSETLPNGNIIFGRLGIMSEESFQTLVKKNYIPTEYDTVTQLETQNAVAYDTFLDNGTKHQVLYTLEEDGKTFRIAETYFIYEDQTSSVGNYPNSIAIYVETSDLFYYLAIDGCAERTAIDYLSYSPIPYNP